MPGFYVIECLEMVDGAVEGLGFKAEGGRGGVCGLARKEWEWMSCAGEEGVLMG